MRKEGNRDDQKTSKDQSSHGKNANNDEVLRRISSVALAHIATHGRKETGEILFAPNPGRADEFVKGEGCILKMSDLETVRLRARVKCRKNVDDLTLHTFQLMKNNRGLLSNARPIYTIYRQKVQM